MQKKENQNVNLIQENIKILLRNKIIYNKKIGNLAQKIK